MNDEEFPDEGSRRRRRAIREDREREEAARRERESAVRRLSNSSTAHDSSFGQRRNDDHNWITPRPRPGTDAMPDLFDQENSTPKTESRVRANLRGNTRDGSDSERSPSAASSGQGASGQTPSAPRTSAQADATFDYQGKDEREQPSTKLNGRRERSDNAGPDDYGLALNHPEDSSGARSSSHNDSGSPARPSRQDPVRRDERRVSAAGFAAAGGAREAATESSGTVSTGRSAASFPDASDQSLRNGRESQDGSLNGFIFDEDQLPPGYEWNQDHGGAPDDQLIVTASDFGRGYQTVATGEGSMSREALRKRQIKKRRRNVTLTIAAAGFVLLMVGFVAVVQQFLGTSEPQDYAEVAGSEVEFEVAQGSGPETVAADLVEQGIIASRSAFIDAYNDLGSSPVLQPGAVTLREEMPAAAAVEQLFGTGEPVWFFSINPGQRSGAIFETISEATEIPVSELQDLSEQPQQFGLPEEAETLEGYLATGEYSPEIGTSAEEILQNSVDITFERLEELGVTEEQQQWETVIEASLVSAEGTVEDYPELAGAINNRLEQDEDDETAGLLQIDASVIYGERIQEVNFTEEQRQNEDNPYNTYIYPGLPPGPIESPSMEALEAVVNPNENDFLYWVTVNLDTGETNFASTFAEHQENVELFNDYCAENAEQCGLEVPGGQVEAEE